MRTRKAQRYPAERFLPRRRGAGPSGVRRRGGIPHLRVPAWKIKPRHGRGGTMPAPRQTAGKRLRKKGREHDTRPLTWWVRGTVLSPTAQPVSRSSSEINSRTSGFERRPLRSTKGPYSNPGPQEGRGFLLFWPPRRQDRLAAGPGGSFVQGRPVVGAGISLPLDLSPWRAQDHSVSSPCPPRCGPGRRGELSPLRWTGRSVDLGPSAHECLGLAIQLERRLPTAARLPRAVVWHAPSRGRCGLARSQAGRGGWRRRRPSRPASSVLGHRARARVEPAPPRRARGRLRSLVGEWRCCIWRNGNDDPPRWGV
jgi:hypothetical protein